MAPAGAPEATQEPAVQQELGTKVCDGLHTTDALTFERARSSSDQPSVFSPNAHEAMKFSLTIAAIALVSVLTVSPSTAANANATVVKCKVVPKTRAPPASRPMPPSRTPIVTSVPTPIPANDDEIDDEYDTPSPKPRATRATKKPTPAPQPTRATRQPTAAPQPTRATQAPAAAPQPTRATRAPTAAPQPTRATPKPSSATTPKPAAAQNGVDPVTCLAAHNQLRAEVGVPPLTWDPALATKGAAWAQHMEDLNFFDHSTPGKSDGQMNNLYSGTDCLGAVAAFGREKAKLPADRIVRQESYMQYGHYTMIVWRTTTRMGCGRGKTKNLACYYEQPGNMIGRAAY